MTNERLRAFARVTLTVEVEVPDSWGADCPVMQVYKQAKTSAVSILKTADSLGNKVGKMRIIGEPKVTAILADYTKDLP